MDAGDDAVTRVIRAAGAGRGATRYLPCAITVAGEPERVHVILLTLRLVSHSVLRAGSYRSRHVYKLSSTAPSTLASWTRRNLPVATQERAMEASAILRLSFQGPYTPE
jgi:hypothetical protein